MYITEMLCYIIVASFLLWLSFCVDKVSLTLPVGPADIQC